MSSAPRLNAKRAKDLRTASSPGLTSGRSLHDDERRRIGIAADIHDDSVQAMLAVDLKLEALKQGADPDTLPLVAEAQELVRGAAQRLRELLFELAPIEPGLSLARALERYLKISMEGCTFEVVNRLTSEPPAETATLAYRIIQEALTNVKKHSCATSVSVELAEVDDGLLVKVIDNGRGFTRRCSEPGHLGLAAMRVRAAQGSGWLTVDSRRGRGTTVSFWLKRPDVEQKVLQGTTAAHHPIGLDGETPSVRSKASSVLR